MQSIHYLSERFIKGYYLWHDPVYRYELLLFYRHLHNPIHFIDIRHLHYLIDDLLDYERNLHHLFHYSFYRNYPFFDCPHLF